MLPAWRRSFKSYEREIKVSERTGVTKLADARKEQRERNRWGEKEAERGRRSGRERESERRDRRIQRDGWRKRGGKSDRTTKMDRIFRATESGTWIC